MEALAGKGQGEGSNVTEAECSKVSRVEGQTDVHTRLPLLDAKQEKQQQPRVVPSDLMEVQPRVVPSDLMEVFSVRFLDFEHHDLKKNMYGCIMIGSFPTYVVFSRKDGEPLNIDSKGFVKLRGPDRVIKPSDSIVFYPYLFRYDAGAEQFKDNETRLLWNLMYYGDFNTLMSKKIRSQFGQIEVKYAAYECGVVARVDVTLTGCRFPSAMVGGLITAQNSILGNKGESILFKTDENEGISIDVSSCKDRVAQLPLARCETAVPVRSSLTVAVDIWQCSITGAPEQAIAKDMKFKFVARLGGKGVKTFIGAACQVNVGVTWSHYKAVDF